MGLRTRPRLSSLTLLMSCFAFLSIYSQESADFSQEVEVTTGLKLTNSSSLNTTVGFQYSLKASLSAGIEGLTAGMESQYTFSMQIESSVSRSEEIQKVNIKRTKYTAPAGKKY